MPTRLPDPVLRSERIYRRLLMLYPKNYRLEYGDSMVQVFRDICQSTYASDPQRGIMKAWLMAVPDFAVSIVVEYEDEFRRWMMDNSNTEAGTDPRSVMGLLISASIVAVGVIVSLVLRETGGPVVVALIAAIVFNLLGALVMDIFTQRDGAILGAMTLLMLFGSLPLLWVPEKTAWIRENPLTLGAIIILTGYLRQKFLVRWPLIAIAIILGAAHILISFI